MLDTRFFTLPQRRNRVWGIACLNTGKRSLDAILGTYNASLDSMQTNFQFATDLNFPKLPEELPQEGRHTEHVNLAIADGFSCTNIFVDCAGSMERRTFAYSVLPCITANHPIYSVHLSRYMQACDYLNAQGLWQSTMSSEVYQELLADPVLAHDLAGNSFSSTVVQAVFISSLACCGDSWASLLPLNPTEPLRRIRKKRPAPQYDALVQHEGKRKKPGRKRKHQQRYRRKEAPKKNKGKKSVASLWDKEKLFCPELFIFLTCYLL